MNDEQRKYKERFEQKKIDGARKQAILEKRRQKEVNYLFCAKVGVLNFSHNLQVILLKIATHNPYEVKMWMTYFLQGQTQGCSINYVLF